MTGHIDRTDGELCRMHNFHTAHCPSHQSDDVHKPVCHKPVCHKPVCHKSNKLIVLLLLLLLLRALQPILTMKLNGGEINDKMIG